MAGFLANPWLWMAISSGLSGLGNMFGGGQEMDSFADTRLGDLSLDPRSMLGHSVTGVGRMGQTLHDWAIEPLSIPGAVVQQPPVFTGGGLPMPIGVTGVDPAYMDPSILSLDGLTNRDPFQGLGNLMSGDPTGGNDAGEAAAALQLLLPSGAWRPQ